LKTGVQKIEVQPKTGMQKRTPKTRQNQEEVHGGCANNTVACNCCMTILLQSIHPEKNEPRPMRINNGFFLFFKKKKKNVQW
jgi:hypothetical protein